MTAAESSVGGLYWDLARAHADETWDKVVEFDLIWQFKRLRLWTTWKQA